MNKSKLKSYAPQARKDFIAMVQGRAAQLGLSEAKGELQIEDCLVQGEVAVIGGQAFPARIAQQRTKSIRLLHKQITKDSTISGMGLADYVVSFRKPGDNQEPVAGGFERWSGDDSLDISREAYDRHAAETIADGRTPWPFPLR